MSKPVPSAKRMGDPGGGLAVFAVAYLLFLYVPVLLLPIFSFNDSIFTAFPLSGFTTKWYSQAFADQDMLRSLVASLQVGAVVAVASTILGLFGAKAVTRYRMPGQGAITGLIMLPLFVPEIVLGIALLILVNNIDLELSLITIGVGHVMLCTPFAMAVLTSRLDGFDKSLEEASMDLGESPWMTFWRVTFPLVAPGIVSSLLLTFIVSFDEFLLSFFLAGQQPTLPVFIWSQLKFPNKLPGVLALGSLILISSCVLVVLAEWVRQLGTSERKVGVA
ncbi:MAG: ABC transporter permease [Alphaproteobacteria bacterium]|nr:ABC transporter permease [Alphaproteobacteria bacterium]